MWGDYVYLAILSRLVLTPYLEAKVSLAEVFRIFDVRSAKKNAHLMILSGHASFQDLHSIEIQTRHILQSFIWVDLEELIQFWENSTLFSSNHELLIDKHRTTVIVHPESTQEFDHLVQSMPPKVMMRTRKMTLIVIWPDKINFTTTDCQLEFRKRLQDFNTTNLNVPLNMNLFFVFFSTSPSVLPPIEDDPEELIDSDEKDDADDLATAEIFRLYELYSIKTDDYFQRVSFPKGKIRFGTLTQILRRRGQFNLAVIPAVADEDITLSKEVSFKIGGTRDDVSFIEGFAVSIYRDFRDMLNFTEKALLGSALSISGTNQVYGKSYEIISSQQAVLSISQITVIENRAEFVTYLQPTSSGNGVRAFFVQPPLNSMRNVFLSPFSSDVWFQVLFTWITIILLMMVFSGVKTHYLTTAGTETSFDETFLNDAYIWAIGALCQKGWPRYPLSTPMRMVFFLGCLTGLVLYVAYSAVIVSVLSVSVVPVKTFSDLLSFKFNYYVHEKSTTMQAFLKSDIIKQFNLTQDVLKIDTQGEVRILLTSTNSLISYPDVFFSAARTLNYSDRFVCENLDSVRANSYPSKSAMFVSKGSSYRETFDYRVMMLKERGFNARYFRKYISDTQITCSSTGNTRGQSLSTTDVYIAFLILGSGFGVSLSILGVEKAYKVLRGQSRFYLAYFIASPTSRSVF